MPTPISKPEILKRLDALARANGCGLSFRRHMPEVAKKGTAATDEPVKEDYYTWLIQTGIWRALVNDPEWAKAAFKGLKAAKKNGTMKNHAEMLTAALEFADGDELRGVFKDKVEGLPIKPSE